MKIITEGNIKETIFLCNDCKCEFSLTDKEINEIISANLSKIK